jgi:hypothetical protein
MNLVNFFEEFFGADEVSVISPKELEVSFCGFSEGMKNRETCRISSDMSLDEIFETL